jgi:hypothetical protein
LLGRFGPAAGFSQSVSPAESIAKNQESDLIHSWSPNYQILENNTWKDELDLPKKKFVTRIQKLEAIGLDGGFPHSALIAQVIKNLPVGIPGQS